jgi:NitT/TauT family transport system permease protein
MKDILMASSTTAWNISWRTLLALEVVFGSIGRHWGLGTYMVTVKDRMDITEMYASLFAIILIGLAFNTMFEKMLVKQGN